MGVSLRKIKKEDQPFAITACICLAYVGGIDAYNIGQAIIGMNEHAEVHLTKNQLQPVRDYYRRYGTDKLIEKVNQVYLDNIECFD